ncbi:hypothetical protein SAY87_018331 [Trapa incisa]|uniref:FAF domain-containing protein n=1 Tax=Trapa incisa TaxID=236973 RepID=A0AAN7QSP4_9MYRT|nr:hypothetical protein SAY87_018331 [Trapa incisa]
MTTVLLQSPTRHYTEPPFVEQLKLKFPAKPTLEFAEFGLKVEALPEMVVENPAIRHSPRVPLKSSYCISSVLIGINMELCTEILGDETGCVEREDTRLGLLSSVPSPSSSDRFGCSKRHNLTVKKRAGPRTFPPPLTTIRGRDSIHFRPRREDGRLVIEAVRATPAHGGLQAERSHGRLRMRFVEETSPASEEEATTTEESGEGEEGGDLLSGDDGRDSNVNNDKFVGKMGNVEVFAIAGGRCTEGGKSNRDLWTGSHAWWAHHELSI